MTERQTVDRLLERARARYRRIDPREAFAAMRTGALLIDIRTDAQRWRDGTIPGALVIDRTVLEWRVDPASGATHQAIPGLDTPLILICAQGYSSSLAVASLLDQDAIRQVVEAWRAAGLPIGPAG